MNLLEKKEKSYIPTMALQLLSGQYNQLGKEYWDHLPVFLKTGKPIARMDNPVESEKEYIRAVDALDWMMKPSAFVASKVLEIGTRRKKLNILDLGAGSGVWSLQMLAEDKNSKATVVDWPSITQVAKRNAEKMNVADRLELCPGNYHELDLGSEKYDLAILGNVTHIESKENLSKLVRSVSRALKPGGEIVIFDVFPAQEQARLSVPLYALGLALRTESGALYSYEQLREACLENQFIDVKFVPLEVTPHTMGMVLGRRFEN